MTKKFLVLIVGLMLILSCFTACGTSKENSIKTTNEMGKKLEPSAEEFVNRDSNSVSVTSWYGLTTNINNTISKVVTNDVTLHKYTETVSEALLKTSETMINKTKTSIMT